MSASCEEEVIFVNDNLKITEYTNSTQSPSLFVSSVQEDRLVEPKERLFQNNYSNQNSRDSKQYIQFKQLYQGEQRVSKPIKPKPAPLPKWRNTNSPEPLQSDVERFADRAIQGKSIPLDDVQLTNAVLIELDKRRREALGATEYLKSKKIGEVIEKLKNSIRTKDRESLHQESLQQAQQRYEEALDALDQCKETWKQKRQQFNDDFQIESQNLSDRQKAQMSDLESLWQDPSMARKFNKRSPQILQEKAREKYQVLAGDLENAEITKRLTAKAEKAETSERYQEYSDAFESARQQLYNDQIKEQEKFKAEHALQEQVLSKEEADAIAICQKRVLALKRALDEEKDISKFVARKYKKGADVVLPMSTFYPNGTDLPLLTKPVHSPIKQDNTPLQLPPLKVKPMRKRR